MSQGDPVPAERARNAARRVMASIEGSCDRIAIAGSLRRGKPTVRDIEIVAVPRWESRAADDIWATPFDVDVLEERLAELLEAGALAARPVENHRRDGSSDFQFKLGPAFKALLVDGIPLDLFVVRPPASWGVIFGLRTGPGDWNTELVTQCQAISRRVRGGQVEAWIGATGRWEPVPTPEEEDFYAALGQPWVDPGDRSVDRVHVQRSIAVAT